MREYLAQEAGGPDHGAVLVDTSIWIGASRRPASAEADELRALLERDEVATTEVVVAEVLQGARKREDFDSLADKLEALHFFSADRAIWQKAALFSMELRNQGLITPLSDLVIAAVALENDLSVYAADEHFNRVAGLRLHQPRNYVVRRKDN